MLWILLLSCNVSLVVLVFIMFSGYKKPGKYIEENAKEYNFKKKPDATNTRP